MARKTKVSKSSKILSKLLVLTIFFLVFLILLKGNATFKSFVYKKVFQTNLNFPKINEIYQKFFGSSLPLKNEEKIKEVSTSKLEYKDISPYKDGAKLIVSKDYVIEAQESGLVIFNDNKEGYGKTVIIQKSDGVEVWYGNLQNTSVSIYDYVKKGDLLGQANGEEIYIVFVKEGKNLDYKKYL